MAIIKTGVIGLGLVGSGHAKRVQEHESADVVAVADVRGQVAEEAGALVGARPYSNHREMLESEKLDLAVVATPDAMHSQPVIDALEAGVPNVIVEKPFATTEADAEAIYEAVERKGARLFVHFMMRAHPLEMATRYVFQSGLLGEAVYTELRMDDNISVPTRMWGDRTREWASSTSTAFFLLSHAIDSLRFYSGSDEVKEVYAVSQRRVLGYTPDLYDAFLTFQSGAKARLKSEWTKHIDTLIEVYTCLSGSEGTLVYTRATGFAAPPWWRANVSKNVDAASLDQHRRRLSELGADVASINYRPEGSNGGSLGGELDERAALETYSSPAPSVQLREHFLNGILENTDEPSSWAGNGPLPTHVDGLQQARVSLAIEQSAREGRPVTLT